MLINQLTQTYEKLMNMFKIGNTIQFYSEKRTRIVIATIKDISPSFIYMVECGTNIEVARRYLIQKEAQLTLIQTVKGGNTNKQMNNYSNSPRIKHSLIATDSLNKDDKTLMDRGYVNQALERTSRGTELLLDILFIKNKPALLVLANKEVLAEKNAK